MVKLLKLEAIILALGHSLIGLNWPSAIVLVHSYTSVI